MKKIEIELDETTYQEFLQDLEKSGQSIGLTNILIAAIAISNHLILVTNNVKHYQRIKALGHSLIINNWKKDT
jgi:tRNA(fMet)-specific endonuclease VapC